MTSKFKAIVSLIAVLALVLVSLGVSKISSQKKEIKQGSEEKPLPAATGNVDDLTAAVNQAADAEDQTLQTDEDATASDDQAASDFDQSYTDNEI